MERTKGERESREERKEVVGLVGFVDIPSMKATNASLNINGSP